MAANVNNYISAGNAAIRSALQARKALAENAPRYDQQAMEAVNQAAKTNANIAKNNARAAQTKMAIEAGMERQRLGAETKEYVQGQYKTARMTGLLAGGAALLGVGAMQMNKEEEENETLALYRTMLDKGNSRIAQIQSQLDGLEDMPIDQSSKSDDTSSTSTSNTSSSASNPKPSFGSQSQSDIYAKIIAKGRSPEFAKNFSAIAMAESGGNPTIDTVQSGLDPNKSNEYSVGLFQVNTQAHMDKLNRRGWTVDDLRDPDKSLDIALEIHDEAGGFKPWGAYTNGSYRAYLK